MTEFDNDRNDGLDAAFTEDAPSGPLPGDGSDDSERPERGVPDKMGRILLMIFAVLLVAAGVVGWIVFSELRQGDVPQTMSGAEIAAIEKQMEAEPDNLVLYMRLAEVYFGAKEYDEAIAALEEIRSRETTGYMEAQALYGLARIAEAQDDGDTAEDYYLASIKEQELESTRYDLGRFYVQSDQIDKGIEQWERYVELNATDGGAMRDLARVYEEEGDLERALELYEQAFVFIPDDTDVQAAIERLGAGSE